MLVCKKCHIEYEDSKNVCSQCGGPLMPKEGPISDHENMNETKEEKVGEVLICPNCKTAYEFGKVCLKCGSTLEAQIPSHNKEEFKVLDITEIKEEFPQVAPPQKQSTEEPVKRLICPSCKILYERGNSCIRCGSSLVTHTPSIEMEEPKISDASEVEEEELKATSIPKADKEPPPTQTPEERPVNELPDDKIGRVTFPSENKNKFPRLSIERVSIIILILIGGGYLLYSTYSYFTTKRHKPNVPTSKEVVSPAPLSSSTPTHPAVSESEPREIINIQDLENIKNLLENIRQANLKKNIDLFMSCYSTTFKNREEKMRTTLETWENFNYLNLSYNVKRHSISGNTAEARVEWLMRFSPQTGDQPQESKTVLDVTFEKEDGAWKIKEIKTVS
jgi:rRNA maturation endonuclease Nob1